jgi:hypothetical protein
MAHRLRTVELDFRNPARFVFEALFPRRRRPCSPISDNPSTWTWWPGHEGGAYETPAPHGVGSRREMHMGDSQYRETILAWDEPTRWAYRVDESADSLIDALVEEWVVEGDGERSTVRWTFAVDPDMEAAIPAAKTMISDMFNQAWQPLRPAAGSARLTRWRNRLGLRHRDPVTDLDRRAAYCDLLGFRCYPADFGFPGCGCGSARCSAWAWLTKRLRPARASPFELYVPADGSTPRSSRRGREDARRAVDPGRRSGRHHRICPATIELTDVGPVART